MADRTTARACPDCKATPEDKYPPEVWVRRDGSLTGYLIVCDNCGRLGTPRQFENLAWTSFVTRKP